MLGWINHKLESRLPEEISITSDIAKSEDELNSLLKNLYAGQEATVRTGHGTTDWFQIGKGVPQGCI